MKISIIENAKRNILFGTISRFLVMLCPFAERTVLIRVLGARYLGLNSLFTSLLSVLSVSELGFGSAIVYNMYKPVAEGDVDTVNAILNLYRKVYRIVGIVVLAVGVLTAAFLPCLIKESYPAEINIYKLYFIYLVNSVIGYFMFAYLSSLLTVYQREDINSIGTIAVTLILTVSKIAVLIGTRDFYLYEVLIPMFTVIYNIWVARTVRKRFPQYCATGNLPEEKIAEIKKEVAGSFIQKACGVTRNSLDSICISAFLGLSLTAVYNNYFCILSGLNGMLAVFSGSFTGGIGNRIAIQTPDKNFEELRQLDFAYLLVSGWCTVCLLCLYQPFMEIWMGKDMLLPVPAMVLFCIYFFMLKWGDIRSLYTSGSGLYWPSRWRALGETICNLTLNIILGRLWGVYGILLATIVSLFLCNYIWSVRITFKYYFKCSSLKYYQTQLPIVLFTGTAGALSFFICGLIQCEQIVGTIIVRGIICSLIYFSLFYIFFNKTEEYKGLKRISHDVFHKKNSR